MRVQFSRFKLAVLWAGALALMTATVALWSPKTSGTAYAATGINQQINFQARLYNAAGAIVPDGNYNIEFKIYCGGDGVPGSTSADCTNSTTEHLLWTEDHLNNNSQGITVKNGYFSVQLGAITALSAVDFNQQTLWLSINVGNTNATCTPFSGCAGDGEMNPYQRFGSNAYAFNSNMLQGLQANNFVQLAQGVQADSSGVSSVFVNKTGSGNIIELQSGGTDSFVVTNTGDLTFGNNAAHNISVSATASTAGQGLTVAAGAAGTGGSALAGGDLTLQGGAGGGTNGNGGNIVINAGAKNGTGTNGNITIGGSNTNNITIGNAVSNFTLQGPGGASGLVFKATNGANATTVTFTAPTSNRSVAFPDAGGTVAVSASGNIALSAVGNITFTGTLPVGNGGTGIATTPTNGQLLIGNGTNYTVATLGTTGLTATTGAGSLSLAVNYGSGANNAAAGANTFTCPSGTGNLTGGGTVVTIGTSGTTCAALNTITSPSFTTETLTGTNPQLTLGTTGTSTGGIAFKGSTAASGAITLQGASNPSTNNYTLTIPTLTASDTICVATLANCTAIGTAGGDLTGTYPNPTIAKLQGGTLTITSVATGQVLNYNGSAWVNTGSPTLSGSLTVQGTGSVLGTASVNGNLGFKNANSGAITVQGTSTASNFTLTLPAENGTICSTGSVCAGYEGSAGTDFIRNQTSAQTANFNIQSAAAGSIGAVISGASGQTADLLQGKSGSNILFDVGANGALSHIVIPVSSESGSALFTDFLTNELANYDLVGGTITTAVTGGATINGTVANVVRSSVGGNSGPNVTFTATGTAQWQLTGVSINARSDANWAPYLRMRAGQNPSQILVEYRRSDGVTWDTIVNDTSPVFSGGLWVGPLASYANYPITGYRITLTYSSTTQSFVREIGLFDRNIHFGTNVFPDISQANTFYGALTVAATGSLLGSSSVNGNLAFQNANTGKITLQGTSTASNFTLTLPAETGTICSTGSICTGYEGSAGTDFIRNQTSLQSSSNYHISGTGINETSVKSGALSTPGAPTPGTASASGGTLATGTYYYKETAIDAAGNESAASSETAGTAVTGPTGSVPFTAIGTVTGAASYRIYRGSSPAGENAWFSCTSATNPTCTDTGSNGGSASPPASNSAYMETTTGSGTFVGALTVSSASTASPLTVTTASNGPWSLTLSRSDVASSNIRLWNNSGTFGIYNNSSALSWQVSQAGNTTQAGNLVVQGTGTSSFAGYVSINPGSTVPTQDQLAITNTGSTGVTTAGVNGLSIAYKGGAAAVESAAERIDLTPGTTSGGTWSGIRIVPNATGAVSGVTENGIKLDTLTTPGAGTENAIYAGTGWDSLLNYNGTQLISGTGLVQNAAIDSTLTYSNLTKVGTLTVGTWNATAIGALYGGTGLNTSASSGVPTISSGTWSVAASLGATLGGTGQTTVTAGDILYGSAANTWSKLADVAVGSVLSSGGVGVAPSWSATPQLGSSSSAGGILFTNSGGTLTLDVATALSASYTIHLPTAAPTAANQCLQTSGSTPFATTTWGTCGGGGHNKTIVLAPEYANATLQADGTNNTGTMTSGADTGTLLHSWYSWTTTQASSQDYDIIVRIPVPSDWSSWNGTAQMCVNVYSTTTTANTIQSTAYNNAGTASTVADITPTATTTWQNKCDTNVPTPSANDVMSLRLHLTSPTSGDIRVGEITLNYTSAY